MGVNKTFYEFWEFYKNIIGTSPASHPHKTQPLPHKTQPLPHKTQPLPHKTIGEFEGDIPLIQTSSIYDHHFV